MAVETDVSPSLTGSAVITIYVIDLNDNGPMLSTGELNYVIEENAIASFTPTVMVCHYNLMYLRDLPANYIIQCKCIIIALCVCRL